MQSPSEYKGAWVFPVGGLWSWWETDLPDESFSLDIGIPSQLKNGQVIGEGGRGIVKGGVLKKIRKGCTDRYLYQKCVIDYLVDADLI